MEQEQQSANTHLFPPVRQGHGRIVSLLITLVCLFIGIALGGTLLSGSVPFLRFVCEVFGNA